VQFVLCYSLAPVHECQYEREERAPAANSGQLLGS
jgi:hypothetical protein